MTPLQARKVLSKIGFVFHYSAWGRQTPEPYSVGKDHFTPYFRGVFFAKCVGGYYVTSHIKGLYRRYRRRRSDETGVGNIFGGGPTLEAAVSVFVKNFTTKTYNRRS
jgi:hypothetical protein